MREVLLLRSNGLTIERQAGASVDVLAHVAERTLLEAVSASPIALDQLASRAKRAVFRTGSPPVSVTDDDAMASFRAWGPGARAALDEAIEQLSAPALSAGITLTLWPHAADVLSDIPSCLSLLRKFESVELIVQPRDLLTETMLPRAEEHLARIFEAFETHPRLFAFADGCDLGQGERHQLPEPALRTLGRLLETTTKPVVFGNRAHP